MQKFEKRVTYEGREARFSNFIDEESFSFENSATQFLENCSIEQTLAFLQNSTREFILMQMRTHDGIPAMQTCIYIGRSRKLPGFAMASIPRLSCAMDGIEEEIGLNLIKAVCSEIPGVMTLRLQPLRYGQNELANFQERAMRQGYHLSDPHGPVRTLVLELCSSEDELISKFSSKTKAKIRHKGIRRVEMRVLTNPKYIEACKRASNESRRRSGSGDTDYEFEAAFALAQKDPTRARVIGLFLAESPEELQAFVIGFRSGILGEYSEAGSFSNEKLRSIPFNAFLLWELFNWARSVGCTRIDLGGVTDGAPSDPLQGISRFKRMFTEHEVEIGRELFSILRPTRYFIYQTLKYLQKRVKTLLISKPRNARLLPAYD